jgi:hypothetical protein
MRLNHLYNDRVPLLNVVTLEPLPQPLSEIRSSARVALLIGSKPSCYVRLYLSNVRLQDKGDLVAWKEMPILSKNVLRAYLIALFVSFISIFGGGSLLSKSNTRFSSSEILTSNGFGTL